MFDYTITIVVVLTSIIQSIFGTGVLLFGTPLLLFLDYDFVIILKILLPISILINILQLKEDYKSVDLSFFKKLSFISLPIISFALFFSVESDFQMNIVVGLLVVFIGLKNYVSKLRVFMKKIMNLDTVYFVVLGIIHGISNLGGSLLSSKVFDLEYDKIKKRATIAACYLLMALTQLITLSAKYLSFQNLDKETYINWIGGVLVFFIINKYVFYRIKNFESLSNTFLLLIGVLLLLKGI
tara:strand:- start:52 stop:771 length:720 start_codon:yes stop_codon:yes gene_type:complete